MFSMAGDRHHTKRNVYYRHVDKPMLNGPFSLGGPISHPPAVPKARTNARGQFRWTKPGAYALPSARAVPRQQADVRSVRVDGGLRFDDWLRPERPDDRCRHSLANPVNTRQAVEARSHHRCGTAKCVEQGLGARRTDVR